jgi:hypothetical protein
MFGNAVFGAVVYNNTVYHTDIYVHPSGTVEVRQKELSTLVHKTSHKVVKAEMELLLKEDPDCILIGTGHNNCLHLTAEAKTFLEEKHVFYQEFLTPKAVKEYNKRHNCAILVHITC